MSEVSIPLFGNSLIPDNWGWERQIELLDAYQNCFALAAVAYLPTIFGLQAFMKHRQPLDLGGGDTKGINWIFWWEVALALFSIVEAMHLLPVLLDSIERRGLVRSICDNDTRHSKVIYWMFVVVYSKIVEFGDTVFIVLRKKPLILLQYYHHLLTMLYCWYGVVVIDKHNNTCIYFGAVNMCVHSVMYTWYAATRTGWRSPKILMMAITCLQIAQMVVGVLIIGIASNQLFSAEGTGCGRWQAADPFGVCFAYLMYAYFVLFAKMFVEKYLITGEPEKPKKDRSD